MNELQKKVLSHVLKLTKQIENPSPNPINSFLNEEQIKERQAKYEEQWINDRNIRSEIIEWLEALQKS